jgi:penicillin-binding protein 1A
MDWLTPYRDFFANAFRTLLIEKKWFKKTVKTIWIATFCSVVAGVVYLYAVTQDTFGLFGAMPSLKDIENPENDLSSEVFSEDGVALGGYARYNRSLVTYDQLPPILVHALLSSEDHRFYEHSGIDFQSYLRVLWGLATFSNQGGGSTLTQQTAKNLFSTREKELQGTLAALGRPVRLFISKTKELIIAIRLEQNFTKEEIIALYLNTVPFNNHAYGIKIASKTYFNKSPENLNTQECALLVGMLQGVARFNPVTHPDRALIKRNEVLQKLFYHHYIMTLREADSLKALPIDLKFAVQDENEGLAPYFRGILQSYLLAWCKEHGYDLFESGLKIYTTLDSRMQRFAEEAVKEHMQQLQKQFNRDWGKRNPWVNDQGEELKNFLQRKIKRTETYKNLTLKFGENTDSIGQKLNEKKSMTVFSWRGNRDTTFSSMDSLRYYSKFLHAGAMAMDPETGAIKAWVGGIDYTYFKYDHVRQGTRQPGSTFKPFIYGLAMEDGYSPCQLFYDNSPTIMINAESYHPKNSNGTYGDGNQYTLRHALAKSLNSVTIQLIDRLKPENVAAFAHRVGISTKLDAVYSLGLGTSDVSLFDMVGAYCSFVNRGIYTAPYFITRIEDKNGNVIENFVRKTKVALDEVTAYKIVHLLKGGIEEEGGTSQALSKNVKTDNEIGGKTGTTDNGSDGWYMGITHNLVTGVWVGGDERSIHFPSWGAGSGSKAALPIWDKFMTKVYAHKEVGYLKGKFKKPETDLEMTLDCSQISQDSLLDVQDLDITLGVD